MLGPSSTGLYNNFNDIHNLYLAKIVGGFFPVSFGFFANMILRFNYEESLCLLYKLKIENPNEFKNNSNFLKALDDCLTIKKIVGFFLGNPNLFHPFNKEIEQYDLNAKKKKISGSKISFLFIKLLYGIMAIFSGTQSVQAGNYDTSFPVVTQYIIDQYYHSINETIISDPFQQFVRTKKGEVAQPHDKNDPTKVFYLKQGSSSILKSLFYYNDAYLIKISTINFRIKVDLVPNPKSEFKDYYLNETLMKQRERIGRRYNNDVFSKYFLRLEFFITEINPEKQQIAFYFDVVLKHESAYDGIKENDFLNSQFSLSSPIIQGTNLDFITF